MTTKDGVKRVVTTRGSSGICLATAQAFLDDGYEVISISRRDCPLRSPRLTSICADLADAAATRDAVMSVAARTPATTIVHCAGAIREKPVEEAWRSLAICISAQPCRWSRRTCRRRNRPATAASC